MLIHIAGGVGEHGRNCFFTQADTVTIMVDCGIRGGAQPLYPDLTDEQIRQTDFLLLTHSHLDHTGAYPWLLDRGFHGQVIGSAETFSQLPFEIDNKLFIQPGQDLALTDGLRLTCGRSGHCVGSLWYELSLEGKQLLFSGDYSESSLLYSCDKIRGRWADVAFLDCARDHALGSAESLQLSLQEAVRKVIMDGRSVILPVPRHGRGLEMMQLLHSIGQLRLDDESQAARDAMPSQTAWFKAPLTQASAAGGSIYFLADSQLKRPGKRVQVERLIEEGAELILTGHAEPDSFAKKLLRLERGQMILYPSHQSDRGVELLRQLNSFTTVVRVHSDRFSSPGDITL